MIRIGNYIYTPESNYSMSWIVCGEVIMGIDGEYIQWYA